MALTKINYTGQGVVPHAKMPSGSVLQVVHTRTDSAISTASTSYVTTGLALAITPKFSTSKLKVMVLGGRNYYNADSVQHDVKLYVDGSAYGGSGRWTSIFNNGGGNSIHYGAWSLVEYIDANSTSARTYQIYHKTSDASKTCHFNNIGSSNDIYVHMILEEIAA